MGVQKMHCDNKLLEKPACLCRGQGGLVVKDSGVQAALCGVGGCIVLYCMSIYIVSYCMSNKSEQTCCELQPKHTSGACSVTSPRCVGVRKACLKHNTCAHPTNTRMCCTWRRTVWSIKGPRGSRRSLTSSLVLWYRVSYARIVCCWGVLSMICAWVFVVGYCGVDETEKIHHEQNTYQCVSWSILGKVLGDVSCIHLGNYDLLFLCTIHRFNHHTLRSCSYTMLNEVIYTVCPTTIV